MAGALEFWAQRLVRRSGSPSAPAGLAGYRLVGAPEALGRVLAVRPGTVVVLLEPGQAPQVRRPGEVVVPPLLAPSRRPVVLPICALPVDLTATVQGSVTFDGHALEPVTVRFSVELDPGDGYAGLLALVSEHGVGLEAALLAAVHQEVARAVVDAVRVNRLTDLQRLTLSEVLRERWWPAAFVGGLLRSVHLGTAQTSWPGAVGEIGLTELGAVEQPRPRRAQLTSGAGPDEASGGGSAADRTVGVGSATARSSGPAFVPAGLPSGGSVVVTSFGDGTASDDWTGTGPVGGPVPTGTLSAAAVPGRGALVAGARRPGEAGREPRGPDEGAYDDGEPTIPLPRVVP